MVIVAPVGRVHVGSRLPVDGCPLPSALPQPGQLGKPLLFGVAKVNVERVELYEMLGEERLRAELGHQLDEPISAAAVSRHHDMPDCVESRLVWCVQQRQQRAVDIVERAEHAVWCDHVSEISGVIGDGDNISEIGFTTSDGHDVMSDAFEVGAQISDPEPHVVRHSVCRQLTCPVWTRTFVLFLVGRRMKEYMEVERGE
ncbi:hypothetical protein [Paenibacillus alvei]|uniref:hypothetical protein n=1 Tax=Paenibacillus alvei TaxID=44250 RepID=UPI0018CF864C|nr:hypothetical protein [Paenibacillus alvei]MCY9578632.1 hypothetical protein [Paenibacillus alvei]